MRKIFVIGLIGLVGFSFTACDINIKGTISEKDKSSVEDNSDKESANDKENRTEKEHKKETADNGKVEINELIEQDNSREEESKNKIERVFKIVTKNENYGIVSDGEIKTTGLGVAENIRKIIGTVSTKYFDGKNIELQTIDNDNNKKIAIINLSGDSDYWTNKMQGSLNGQVTEYTLIENVLQREYKGYWVDGVKFTIDGNLVQDNGHIPALSTITYR